MVTIPEQIALEKGKCCYYRTLFERKRYPIVEHMRYDLRYFFYDGCDCGCHELGA